MVSWEEIKGFARICHGYSHLQNDETLKILFLPTWPYLYIPEMQDMKD